MTVKHNAPLLSWTIFWFPRDANLAFLVDDKCKKNYVSFLSPDSLFDFKAHYTANYKK